MEKFSLLEAQAKRSKALHNDNLRDYFLWDSAICAYLGLHKQAYESLILATKEGK